MVRVQILAAQSPERRADQLATHECFEEVQGEAVCEVLGHDHLGADTAAGLLVFDEVRRKVIVVLGVAADALAGVHEDQRPAGERLQLEPAQVGDARRHIRAEEHGRLCGQRQRIACPLGAVAVAERVH